MEARGVGVSDGVTVGVREGLGVEVGSWAVSVGRGVSEAIGIIGVETLGEGRLARWVSPVEQAIAPRRTKTNRAARTPY